MVDEKQVLTEMKEKFEKEMKKIQEKISVVDKLLGLLSDPPQKDQPKSVTSVTSRVPKNGKKSLSKKSSIPSNLIEL